MLVVRRSISEETCARHRVRPVRKKRNLDDEMRLSIFPDPPPSIYVTGQAPAALAISGLDVGLGSHRPVMVNYALQMPSLSAFVV